MTRLIVLAVLLTSAVAAAPGVFAQTVWPTCRGNSQRTSYADVSIPPSVRLVWSYHSPQPPQPAWPPPARGSLWQRLASIAPRVVDDHAFHPILGENAVLFASSADDSVSALNAETGKTLWRYTTDGPVRYAPALWAGHAFFGSDDGHVYCLDATTGDVVWTRQVAPGPDRIPGNGRLISVWPVRTGVLVEEGVVYATAGLFPSQRVVAVALDAQTGEPRWQTDLEYAAQGYLLASSQALFVPTGRGTPLVLEKYTGRTIGHFTGAAGSYALVNEEELIAGPGDSGSLDASDVHSHEKLVSFAGSTMALAPESIFLLGNRRLSRIDRARYMRLSREANQLEKELIALREQMERLAERRAGASKTAESTIKDVDKEPTWIEADLQRRIAALERLRAGCETWSITTEQSDVLTAAANAVVIGGANGLAAYAPEEGRLLWRQSTSGRVLGLALANDRIVAVDHHGNFYVFASSTSSDEVQPNDVETPTASQPEISRGTAPSSTAGSDAQRCRQVVAQVQGLVGSPRTSAPRGYVVLAGLGSGQLAEHFAAANWQVVVFERNAAQVRLARQRWIEQGVYGARLAIHHVEASRLPAVDFVATALLSENLLRGNTSVDEAELDWPLSELERIVTPAGGVFWVDHDAEPKIRSPLSGTGAWRHQYANLANTANSGDEQINGNLALQWFGGPGPATMVDRHLRAPAPLAGGGRLLVLAENLVHCVDSYNGSPLWELATPRAQRYSIPYDCGYASLLDKQLALAVDSELWLIDVVTGQVQSKQPLPASSALQHPTTNDVWGYVALTPQGVVATQQKRTASRTAASRRQVDIDYGNDQPLVTSQRLFHVESRTGKLSWEHQGVIINSTVTLSDDRVWFVEADKELTEHETGRISLADLMKKSAHLVGLDLASGEPVLRRTLPKSIAACRNILYLQASQGDLVLSGSLTRDNDTWYRIAVVDAAAGEVRWEAEHSKGAPDAFSHGEQVHHPAILGNRLVAEPFLYDMTTGRRTGLNGESSPWKMVRPGHSCGTLSAGGDCLFFRADNPTVLDFSPSNGAKAAYQTLAPTRAGCWINIVPADGLVLIPEASASCVCHYTLQTSLALRPVP